MSKMSELDSDRQQIERLTDVAHPPSFARSARAGVPTHTPGPWGLRHSRDGSGDVGVTANGVANVIAECFAAMRSSGENARDEASANARLIAAAPDLLEALQAVVAVADRKTDEFDRARAAIARAVAS